MTTRAVGARRMFHDVANLVGLVESFGGPPLDADRWFPWILDHDPQLRHRERGCCVDLRDCLTPAEALRQVQDVARSPWSTDVDVAALVRAMTDVLGVWLPTLDDEQDVALRVAQAHARIAQPPRWWSTT